MFLKININMFYFIISVIIYGKNYIFMAVNICRKIVYCKKSFENIQKSLIVLSNFVIMK